MSANAIESPMLAGADDNVAANHLRQKFLDVATTVAVPIAEHLGVSLSLAELDSSHIHWIGGASLTNGHENAQNGQKYEAQWPLKCRGADLGQFRVRFPQAGAGEGQEDFGANEREKTTALIRKMTNVALDQLENSFIEEELLNEVSNSHERLSAVYEISKQLFSFQNVDKILDQILLRASSIQKGSRAVLWIERNGRLEPIQGSADPTLSPRGIHEGLVGKAMAKVAPIVSKRQPWEPKDPIEPELSLARWVLVAPVETRQGQRVALELWSEDEENSSDLGSPVMHLALSMALQAAMVVENERLHRESLENERLRREVEIGSRIQQTLLISAPPKDLSGATAGSLTISSRMVDGDFIEFFRHDNRCFDIVVGDVMGKGIPAALLGAGAKSELHRAMSQLLFLDNSRFPEPSAIVQQCHQRLVKRLIELESFITLCYARIDLRRRELMLVDCGHTATAHYSHAQGKCVMLQGENVPLGFSEQEKYQQQPIPFQEGDVFVFYSDGLTEARDTNGEFFGEQRLLELIELYRDSEAQGLINIIERAVIDFSKDGILNDDLTCVVVKISANVPASVRLAFLEVTSQPKELSRIRKFIHEICRCQIAQSWTDEQLYHLEVAVNEAATNIMEHAYLWKTDRWIRIEANVSPDQIEISLAHDGKPFNPRDAEPPRFDGSRDGGFGLFIINNYVDEALYTRDDSGANLIRLTKKRNG